MYHERKIYSKLIKNINNKKIIILMGARQVGKTTLMKAIFESVKKENKSAFIDMDISSNMEIGGSLEKFLDFLALNGYHKKLKKFFVFIDEFQRVPEMAKVLKNIYDHYPNIKIFASGSSSLAIKTNIKESLAGRKFIFEIFPLDFEEFLAFKQDKLAKKYYKNIRKIKGGEISLPAKLNRYLEEFLMFGGYPEVVLTGEIETKKMILGSIFDLYIEKDIMAFSGIENISAFKKIIELLAVLNGQLLNYNQLAKDAGVHNKTVRSYLSLLEGTYLTKIIKPFYSNKKKEITKSPKIYFIDNGVRNYFLNNYNALNKRVDKGQIWESYILQELVKDNLGPIKFWRTKQGSEVDFVMEKENIIPIEVKYISSGKSDDYRNMINFLDEYKIRTGFILSKNQNKTIIKAKKKIIFNPAVNFLTWN